MVLSPRRAGGRKDTAGAAATPGADRQHEKLILSEALKKKPGHAPVLMRLAQIAEDSGSHTEAVILLQGALRAEPENTDARLELGRALFQAGDVRGSIAQTKQILDRHPDHPDALYNLGAIYANLNDRAAALTYWNRLFASSPQSESALRARRLMAELPKPDNSVAVNHNSYEQAVSEKR